MTWELSVENVAGILEGTARIEPGTNAVRASNWQGKSSFVAAVETALGTAEPLTEGAERGGVTLETGERRVAVDLRRENGRVSREGEPYLRDEYDVVRAELFACLGERNELRRAVREGENLEDVLLRPLDFQNIDERIADLKRDRESIEAELANAEEAAKRLPAVEARVREYESELEELRERRNALAEGNNGEGSRDDLAEARSEREQAANRVERLEGSVERAEERLAERRAELETIEVAEDRDVAEELAAAREAYEERKRDAEVLQSVYSANKLVLDEDRLDLVTEVNRELTGDTVSCWTCGEDAPRERIEAEIEALGEHATELRAKAESERDRVETLEAKREEVKQARRRRSDLKTEIEELEASVEENRASLASARERLSELDERVAELTDAVDEAAEELSDVESEIKYREAELGDAREEREELEIRAEGVDTLREQQQEIRDEIEALRNRKDEVARETRTAFDAAMRDVLSRFDAGFETARLTPEFDLVVAREGREAELDALSEGELELLGFVAALAGHEAFDVGEDVPVMLVDSVGELAEDNLHTLVEYLRERVPYLVFTVYPEYAEFDGAEIHPGDWEIATGRAPAE